MYDMIDGSETDSSESYMAIIRLDQKVLWWRYRVVNLEFLISFISTTAQNRVRAEAPSNTSLNVARLAANTTTSRSAKIACAIM